LEPTIFQRKAQQWGETHFTPAQRQAPVDVQTTEILAIWHSIAPELPNLRIVAVNFFCYNGINS
jgi:hypothetical protein